MIVVTMLEILDIVTISGAGPGRRLATILGIVPAQARRPPRIFVRASRGERRHMAQKVLIQLVDDLDGTASVGDAVKSEVDLSADNAERIRTMFGEYIPHARRTGGRLNRGTSAGASRSSDASEASAIREWAQQNGIELAARGRIPGHVVEKYQDAKQAAAESPKKARATKRRTKATAN